MEVEIMKQLSQHSFHLPARRVAAAAALVAIAAVGCGSSDTTNMPTKTAADHANYIATTRCNGVNEGQPVNALLSGQTVLGVRPLYTAVDPSKGGANEQLHGAVVTVAAEPGVTAEWLDRVLECHSAGATLGQTADDGDPFFLPDAVVDINVQPAKDGFAIQVSTNLPRDAQRILDRATSWAPAKVTPAVSLR
jgi:hypothetical protein